RRPSAEAAASEEPALGDSEAAWSEPEATLGLRTTPIAGTDDPRVRLAASLSDGGESASACRMRKGRPSRLATLIRAATLQRARLMGQSMRQAAAGMGAPDDPRCWRGPPSAAEHFAEVEELMWDTRPDAEAPLVHDWGLEAPPPKVQRDLRPTFLTPADRRRIDEVVAEQRRLRLEGPEGPHDQAEGGSLGGSCHNARGSGEPRRACAGRRASPE
ncbi:unnamed protein product, partial [Prorocentrum cordatum]